MKRIALLGIGALCLFSQSDAISCEDQRGWVTVEHSQLMKDEWRRHSATGFGQVTLDMNGDGISDHASLVVSRDGTKSGVKVCLGSEAVGDADPNCRVLAESENVYSVMGLEMRSPGCYEFHEDEAGEPSEGSVCSKFDALEYFRFGSSSSFFVYNTRSGNFERYWDSH